MVVASVVALSGVVAGCGVSQQDVDAIAADRDALTTQLADAQDELATVTGQRDVLAASSEDTKQALSTLTDEFEQLQTVSSQWEARAKTAETQSDEWEARAKTAETERDSALSEAEQSTADLNAILLTYDTQLRAARTRLQSDLEGLVCEAQKGDPQDEVDVARFVSNAIATIPKLTAALVGFDVADLIDMDRLEGVRDDCLNQAILTSPKGDGFYTVGDEIAVGTWRSTGDGDNCYWERLTQNQGIIDNHYGKAGGTVRIRASDYEVDFDGCGTWEYRGP